MEQLSGSTWTNTNTSSYTIGNVATSSTVRMVSKPSITSWRYISQNYIYQNSLNMHTALNSHEMKNSEWGAVSYLTQSAYGRNGNEIAVNQCKTYYTGAGPGTGTSTVYNSTYDYAADTFASTYAWNTAQGKLASTTGNIYGIYDMSGGAYEYVAAYVNNGHANITGTSFGGALGSSTDLKTKQIYASTVTDGSNSQSADYALAASVHGDAVYEISTSYSGSTSWHSDYSYFPYSGFLFFRRGGYYPNADSAGVFYFYGGDGYNYSNSGFRPVLCIGTAHTVTYNANGGTIAGTIAETTTRKVNEGYTYGSATYGMPEATKRGHVFLGWYTEENGGTRITENTIATSSAADQTLYAHWEVAQPTVTFNSNKGSFDTGTTNTVKYTFVENDTEIAPSILEGEYKEPTRDGYEFMGWSKTSDATKVEYQSGINNIPDESGTVYAVWAITVAFDANGGTITGLGSAQTTRILIPGSKYEDASAGFPATTRTGYTFLGWFTENDEQITASTIVDESLNGKTLTAKWQATSYTISYTLNGGTVNGTNPTTYTIESDDITLINPTKSGYVFVGWTGTGVSTAQTTVTILKGSTGNKTYTANWRAERELIASIANEPILGEGMKAVYWADDNGNGETTSETYPAGTYNYTQGNGITDTKETKWANAVTTSDGSYWVWIPRYAYKITYYTNANKTTVSTNKTKYGDIDVLFLYGTSDTQYRDINGNAVELPEGYIVHPAFQAMTTETDLATNPLGKWEEELEGIWVAKYEASRETSSDSGSTWVAAAGTNRLTATGSSRVVSKPSVTSWRSISENYIYQNSLNMHSTLNSHEMKNSEWGAVSYLTQSAYGRNGNELAVNQCSSYYTGAGPGTGTSIIYNSTYAYDASTFTSTYAWNTTQGKLASTTGNIYGVYDMSGGAWEYVAAYVNNGHSNITGTSYGGVLGTSTDLKTKQIYASTVTDGNNSQSADYALAASVYGDAVYETSTNYSGSTSWYSDYSGFPNSGSPFFRRGVHYKNTDRAGVFAFDYNLGFNNTDYGFRPVLCVASGTAATTYEVTFNGNGGTIDDLGSTETTRIVAEGSTYGEAEAGFPEATRDGYKFLGWFTEVTGGTQITAETVVDATALGLTLYARWEVAAKLTANAPVLGTGMKAVYWSDDNATEEIVADKHTSEMYSYVKGDGKTDSKDSKWANAITESDGSYWVWIPRYAYKITYYTSSTKTTVSTSKTKYGDIDILFMKGTSDTEYYDEQGNIITGLPTGYKVHPAFQKMTTEADLATNPLGKWNEELEGIWVAKYEASMETLSSGTWTNTNTSSATIGDIATSSTVRMVSKPSVISWRRITQSNIYANSKNMHTALNSHAMKNSEWGAVAYLTQSAYGRNGNEIAVNQCTGYYTGAGPGTGTSTIYNSTYAYDASNFSSTYAWNTAQGKLASTTGNIYGVYDMSGGAYEYTAAYVSNGHSNITGTSYGGVLGTSTDLKTKQIYASQGSGGTSTAATDYAANSSVYGDAVYETSTSYGGNTSWHSDCSYFPYSSSPLFGRGGYYANTGNAGVFYFNYGVGSSYSYNGFRPVLCVASGT